MEIIKNKNSSTVILTLNLFILTANRTKPKNGAIDKIEGSVALIASFHHRFSLPYLLI